MPTDSPYDRLHDDLRFKLDNIAASWRMEGQELSVAETDVLARYLLGEVPESEVISILDQAP